MSATRWRFGKPPAISGQSLLSQDSVEAGETCDLLIFRLRLKCLGKDRSLVALDSSYTVPTLSNSMNGVVTCIQVRFERDFQDNTRELSL
ncbi:hypothetical protein EMIT043CA1_30170 [Pseudomonas brassicacearum]